MCFVCLFVYICVSLLSHGKVVNKGPFGDLYVEADALSIWARVNHGALDCSVNESWRNPALHLITLNSDVIALDSLQDIYRAQYTNQSFMCNLDDKHFWQWQMVYAKSLDWRLIVHDEFIFLVSISILTVCCCILKTCWGLHMQQQKLQIKKIVKNFSRNEQLLKHNLYNGLTIEALKNCILLRSDQMCALEKQ